jgi:glycosyltransferase involved in cell wall biosynthesis
MTLPADGPLWSIVIAYYNERDFIRRTLESAVAQQGTSFRLVLVDNRSDDDTADLCRDFLAAHPGVEVRHVHEDRPGHAYAVDAGFALVDTPFVAFWDADTVYPPHYLATAQRVLERTGAVLAQATDLYCPPDSRAGRLIRWRYRLTQLVLSRQGHTGFFGICARADALRRCGGPMNADWPWVLEDHELIHRLLGEGRNAGSVDLWCLPAPRRTDNAHVRWTLFERVLYHVTPFALKDWFFYRFLAARFERRRMVQANLRQRDW